MGQTVTTVTAGRRFLAGDKKYTIRRDFASDYQAALGDLVSKNRAPSRIVHLWAMMAAGPTVLLFSLTIVDVHMK